MELENLKNLKKFRFFPRFSLLFLGILSILFVFWKKSPVFALTKEEKEKATQEFKEKIFSEEELRTASDGKNALDDEDFNVILEPEDPDEAENGEERNRKDNIKDKILAIGKKKEEEAGDGAAAGKEMTKGGDREKKKEVADLAAKTGGDGDGKNGNETDVAKNAQTAETNSANSGSQNGEKDIFNKLYNISDTGVSEEFLYSEEYKKLLNNTTTLQKTGINKESDIPILYSIKKNILDFSTSDIPDEILDYKRTEENKNIPNILSDRDMRAVAIDAIMEDNFAVFRGVIEQVGDPDYMVDNNRSALVFCIENGNDSLVRYLIYGGVSINLPDAEGNTPLHVAVRCKNITMVRLLVENGADFDIQNSGGITPLMAAIENGSDAIAIYLMHSGANVELKNNVGDSAYSLSLRHRRRALQQYIINILQNGI